MGRMRLAALPKQSLRYFSQQSKDKYNYFCEIFPPSAESKGLRFSIKNNFSIAGKHVTCGSKMLKEYIAPYDATIVEKIKQSNCEIVGTTNMDEFGMGSSTTTSIFGPATNPWSPAGNPHVCGGSSGGAAGSVALRMCDVGIGSDTGGSIRQPAALTGLIGFKPTYGRVSRYGLVAYASSLDTVGWVTRSVDDAKQTLELLAGHDPRDATSARLPLSPISLENRRLRIAVPQEYLEAASPEVQQACHTALDWLRENFGATISTVNLTSTKYALSAYYVIASAEAASNLSRYDGVRYGGVLSKDKPSSVEQLYTDVRSECFGEEVQRRLRIGTFALSSEAYDNFYTKAAKVRTVVRREFADCFQNFDLVITPTTPGPAWPLKAALSPMETYQQDVMTVPISLAGLPSLSVPVGLSSTGLPLGLQVVGPSFGEQQVLAAGACLEEFKATRTILDKTFD